MYEVGKVVVPIAVGTVLLVVLLRWAPSAGPPPRDSWPAALVGAVALWALSVGFAAFIGSFGSYNVVYGSLAAVVVFLVFVYLAANLVLFTAAFAAEWRGWSATARAPSPAPAWGPRSWASSAAWSCAIVLRRNPGTDGGGSGR